MTSVRLISITPDIEKLIAYCARVSSKNQSNEKITKLIRYLIDNKHWSPFEMGNMIVEIETTRAIAPQILRHRSFCVGPNTWVYALQPNGKLNKHNIAELAGSGICKSKLNLLYLDEETGLFETCNMLDVWKSGKKQLFKITLGNGFELELTEDHRFLTDEGWKTLQDGHDFNVAVLNPKKPIYFLKAVQTGLDYSPIVSVEPLGIQSVYDISMANDFHNFVGNGIVLHNCFQELSLRYASPYELERPLPGLIEMAHKHEWRLQDFKNRQNSIEPDENKQAELASFTHEFAELCKYAEDLYDRLLQAGVAKESARFVLPMIQPTRLYMNGTIRSWLHYCQLRADKATQKEHREIAEQVLAVMKQKLPIVYEAAFGD